MSNYWKARTVELEKLVQNKTNATIEQVNKLYVESSKAIAKRIAKIFEAYKNGGQIDSRYALQLLSAKQTAEVRRELLEQLSKTTDKKARRQIISILDAPAYADRIRRLQALQDLIRAEALSLGVAEEKLTTARLKDIAETSYYRTIYNDQINEGKVYNFNKISDRQLRAMLVHNWSGSNYSSRIWKNNDRFIENLQNTIEVGCMTGSSLKDLEDRIIGDCIGETSDEGQRFCASRLIRTEVNYFANQGIIMGYTEAGITRYRFLATLDLRTSEICRKLDLKSFTVSEAETGVNLPPMHPFCRSVTVPDTGSRTGTRWARDPATGKSIMVPADMTYQQWYEKYVAEGRINKINWNKSATSADRKQFDNYKNILGSKAPKTLDEFCKIKYNGGSDYADLKLKYKDGSLQKKIRNDYNLNIETGKQGKHIKEHNNYEQGKSYLSISMEEAQQLVKKYAGTGKIQRDAKGKWTHTEIVTQNKQNIGYAVSFLNGKEYPTSAFKIHYSKNGTHIVPTIK